MKFAVCVLSLGYTRLAGITLYDSVTRDFTETTTRVAKDLIESGLVKGVKWDKEKECFMPDKDFNMQDILVKTAVGKYRPLLKEIPGEPVNSTYSVVRVITVEAGKLYEVISNKCQRIKLTEEQLRGLNAIGNVSGVFITDDEVRVCDGVVTEDRTSAGKAEPEDTLVEVDEDGYDQEVEVETAGETSENNENNVEVSTEPVEEPKTMEQVFSGLDTSTETKEDKQVKKPRGSKKKADK